MEVHPVVRRYAAAFQARDSRGCAACFGPDGTYSDPSRNLVGLDAIADEFEDVFATFPDLTTETVGLDPISDQMAVWRWIIRGKNTGPFRGGPATDRTIELPGCEFIEVRNGLIQHAVGYWDRLTLLTQLGLVPAPTARNS